MRRAISAWTGIGSTLRYARRSRKSQSGGRALPSIASTSIGGLMTISVATGVPAPTQGTQRHRDPNAPGAFEAPAQLARHEAALRKSPSSRELWKSQPRSVRAISWPPARREFTSPLGSAVNGGGPPPVDIAALVCSSGSWWRFAHSILPSAPGVHTETVGWRRTACVRRFKDLRRRKDPHRNQLFSV